MSAIASGEPRQTTYSALTDLLREEIISGRLPGGSRVTIAEVATRYGVSQMPVREALQCLQGEGLVILSPHRGARVLSIDQEFVGQIYDLRGAIESLLARLSLPNLTNSAMAELEDLLSKLEIAARNTDTEAFLDLNRRFHLLLYRYADNPIAAEIYNRYTGIMDTFRRKYGYGPGRLSEIAAGLAEVLDAVRRQDAEQLARLVAMQAEVAKRDLLALMARTQSASPSSEHDAIMSRLLSRNPIPSNDPKNRLHT